MRDEVHDSLDHLTEDRAPPDLAHAEMDRSMALAICQLTMQKWSVQSTNHLQSRTELATSQCVHSTTLVM